jgi:ketosteroid isomerase-like protein
MNPEEQSVMDAVERLLAVVARCDAETYRKLVAEDVSSFEFDIAPFRIDTLDFHMHLLKQNAQTGAPAPRIDILTPRVQVFGNVAIASYTLLKTVQVDGKSEFRSCNESRVFEKRDGTWVMVHFHRSAAG